MTDPKPQNFGGLLDLWYDIDEIIVSGAYNKVNNDIKDLLQRKIDLYKEKNKGALGPLYKIEIDLLKDLGEGVL